MSLSHNRSLTLSLCGWRVKHKDMNDSTFGSCTSFYMYISAVPKETTETDSELLFCPFLSVCSCFKLFYETFPYWSGQKSLQMHSQEDSKTEKRYNSGVSKGRRHCAFRMLSSGNCGTNEITVLCRRKIIDEIIHRHVFPLPLELDWHSELIVVLLLRSCLKYKALKGLEPSYLWEHSHHELLDYWKSPAKAAFVCYGSKPNYRSESLNILKES